MNINKILTSVTILLLTSAILNIPYAQAEAGDLLLEINNPTPEENDFFGYSVASTPNGDILVGALADNTGAVQAGSVYLFKGILSQSAPIITTLIADDPDDLDGIYSVGDTIVIQFDSITNMPGGTGVQTRTAVNDLFTFTELLGQAYSGQWITPDTFTITINSANNAGLPVIGVTTVTPTETTPILSADEISEPSSVTSPVLSGDFGTTSPTLSNDWIIIEGIIYYNAGNVGIGMDNPNSRLQVDGYIQLDVSSGVPPAEDCDGMDEVGRMKVDDSSNSLYVCTASGWMSLSQ